MSRAAGTDASFREAEISESQLGRWSAKESDVPPSGLGDKERVEQTPQTLGQMEGIVGWRGGRGKAAELKHTQHFTGRKTGGPPENQTRYYHSPGFSWRRQLHMFCLPDHKQTLGR